MSVDSDVAKVVALSDAHRDAWIRTVLVVVQSEPQRRAFVWGYNGTPLPPPNSSAQMRKNHALGLRVRAALSAPGETK